MDNLSILSDDLVPGEQKSVPLDEYELITWRRLEETKSKLANVIEVAGIMSSFSVVSVVELQINDGDVNPGLLIAFAITTSILVGLTTLSILMSVCVLPHIQSITRSRYASYRSNFLQGHQGQGHPIPLHERFLWMIEWSCFGTNTVAILLFTIDIVLMYWIKFRFFSLASSRTVTLIPVIFILFALAIIFYRDYVKQQWELSSRKLDQLDAMRRRIDILTARASTSTSSEYSSYSNFNERFRTFNFRPNPPPCLV